MDFKKFPDRELRNNLSIPFIWGMVIPVMILDIFLIIYHHICFRLYKLPLITRKKYVKMDRHKLEYLSFMDKIRCYYCGYANGVFAYAVKIAGDSEKYWCGIKHAKDPDFIDQPHQENFPEYGDQNEFELRFINRSKKQ